MRGIIGLVFWSAIGLVPVASALLIWSLKRRRDRLIALPPVTALLGFLVGGVAGWTSTLPAQWSASFWTTVEAAGNSAKYRRIVRTHCGTCSHAILCTPPSSARSCSDSPRCFYLIVADPSASVCEACSLTSSPLRGERDRTTEARANPVGDAILRSPVIAEAIAPSGTKAR